jgi:hypothetical protein
MAQLVFEFWSKEIEPVVEAISRILDSCPTENTMAPLSLQYEPTHEGLSFAAHHVRTGSISSFVLRPKNNPLRYAMLNGPDIGGVKRPGYMGTIEYTGNDYSPIWSQLLDSSGLRIVCLGFEEGVQITEDYLTAGSLPWEDSFMVIGAVRSRTGEWIIKHGSRYFSC